MKRTPLQRRTPLKKKRSKPRTHKLVVRLTGEALMVLRIDCWERDKGICQECGIKTKLYWPRFAGEFMPPDKYDMAHIRNKRMYGDTLENVRTLCHACHMKEHTEGKKAA